MTTAIDGRGDAAAFTAFQRAAWSNLVLSVTQRCPLSCRHCITNSTNGAGLPVLAVEQAQAWAAELPGLRRAGLTHLTFTGGEPTLARAAVAVLAGAARDAGIATSIVTSGAFARSPAAATRCVDLLSDVRDWDFGYDVYHAEHLPLELFGAAVVAARDAGHPVSVRVCLGDAETSTLLERLSAICGPGVPIITQSVRRLGRAGTLPGATHSHPPPAACPSSGPLVREDGSVAPCCAGLAYPRRDHLPFRFGNAVTDGLTAVWHAWREDQALRLMRLAGLTPVIGWLRAKGLPAPSPAGDVCELCTGMWDRGGRAAAAVAAHTRQPEVREKLDLLEKHLYGAVWKPADTP